MFFYLFSQKFSFIFLENFEYYEKEFNETNLNELEKI